MAIFATTERDLTGGALGMGGLRFPFDVGNVKQNEFAWLLITAVVVVGIFLYARHVHRSPYGRLLIATGSNEALARSLGKSTYRTKLILFAFSSALMGLLGAMFGVMERFLAISNLGVDLTLAVMVGLVLGGSARVWGAVVGVVAHGGALRHRHPVLRAAPARVVHAGPPRACARPSSGPPSSWCCCSGRWASSATCGATS